MNLDLIRSFFAIVEHGSLNRAAEHLRVSQSTLTRQMHALEHEIGGRLLERGSSGVAPTAAGLVLAESMRPALASIDAALEKVRAHAQGRNTRLRVGYLMSAAADFVHPALCTLRRAHPEITVELIDLSPGEQIQALRRGALDVALLGNPGSLLSREFFVRRLASLVVVVAMPAHHPLAARSAIAIADLRREHFVGAPEHDLPGHNRWVIQLCRRARFRPRFVREAQSLTDALATVAAENAVDLQPAFTPAATLPGVVFRPLTNPPARWDLVVAWQRGRTAPAVRALLESFPKGQGTPEAGTTELRETTPMRRVAQNA